MGKLLQIWFITTFYGLLKLIFTIFAVAMENVFLATNNKNRFLRSYEDSIPRKYKCMLLGPKSPRVFVYIVDYICWPFIMTSQSLYLPSILSVRFRCVCHSTCLMPTSIATLQGLMPLHNLSFTMPQIDQVLMLNRSVMPFNMECFHFLICRSICSKMPLYKQWCQSLICHSNFQLTMRQA